MFSDTYTSLSNVTKRYLKTKLELYTELTIANCYYWWLCGLTFYNSLFHRGSRPKMSRCRVKVYSLF
jgi:hypothetical protein